MSLIACALLLTAGSASAAPAWHAELGLLERDGAAVYVRHHPRTGAAAEHVLTAREKALLDEALAKIPEASWRAEAARIVRAAVAEKGLSPQALAFFEDAKGETLTRAGLEAVPGAVLKDLFAETLFVWAPDVSPAAAVRAAEAKERGERALRDIGLPEGREASSYVTAVTYRAATSGEPAAPPPSTAPGGEPAKRVAWEKALLRELPGGARGVLRYVVGVSVEGARRSGEAESGWDALNLTSSVKMKPGKSDVFIGVAGQW